MKATVEELKILVEEIMENDLLPLLLRKNHDYSGTENALENFSDFGWKGILVRIGDKYNRLKNFVKSEKLEISDEKIEDTMIDIINYCILQLICYRLTKKGD